jgi:hypothetical protein
VIEPKGAETIICGDGDEQSQGDFMQPDNDGYAAAANPLMAQVITTYTQG